MTHFKSFIILIFLASSLNAFAKKNRQHHPKHPPTSTGCDLRNNPYGFACAKAIFQGKVYPMANLYYNTSRIAGSWDVKVLSAPKNLGNKHSDFDNDLMQTLFHGGNIKHPHSVVWKPSSNRRGVIGPIEIIKKYNQLEQLKFYAKSGRSNGQGEAFLFDYAYQQLSRKGFSTLVFRDVDGVVELKCRMYVRRNQDHLSCGWFDIYSGVFTGFFGAIPSFR